MDDADLGLDKWRSQMRKGFLELCVLAAIDSGGRAYGLDLMDRLAAAGLELSEGTIYPLLTRLVREERLGAEWETPERGHPRKYYRLTESGRSALVAMRAEYESDFGSYRSLLSQEEAGNES